MSEQSEKDDIQTEKSNMQSEKGSIQAEKSNMQSEKGSIQAEKSNVQAEKVYIEGKSVNMQIRKMRTEDIKEIAGLEAALFSDAWTEKALRDTLRYRQETNFVAEADDRIIGYLLFMTAADEGELLRIGVSPDARRQGAALALMSHMACYAADNGIASIWLEVRESNEAARLLYQKTGFITQGQRKNYYHNPTENAVIMSRVFPNI